ncbi:DUF6538 domain-containing protein [Rhodobacter aestuarii]|nr:DUF6538 domain-containing protein [Rhodobacter aestuarii]
MMPTPTKATAKRNCLFRVRVPADILSKVRGTTLQIELDGRPVRVSVGEDIKLSLRTRDTAEAKRRHASVLAQVNAHWDAVRAGPKPLSHKDTLALAGEIYRTFIDVLDEDPGSPELWERVIETDRAVLQPQPSALQSLMVGKQAQSTQIDPEALEARFGGFVDVILQRHRVVTDDASRQKLMIEFGKALIEAARINKQKAEGDYSESGETKRYPEFKREAAKPEIAATPGIGLTFDQIIDAEIKRRATGLLGENCGGGGDGTMLRTSRNVRDSPTLTNVVELLQSLPKTTKAALRGGLYRVVISKRFWLRR